jgi:4-diphosphocytidyl-2-C-methyl-D-erythritol kinase
MADQPNTLTLPSPAKINLFLHIVGKRSDGYHNLQTVFQFLTLQDTLRFDLNVDQSVILESQLPGVEPADNLIIKAAHLLKNKTGCTKGARIQLEKRIPMGSGLGGGSSNAATTLIALNRLWQLNLNTAELLSLGRQLGADVGIFIYGHAAFAEGIGDEFTAIEPPTPWYVILVPAVHVSTIDMYKHPQLIRDTPKISVEDYLSHHHCHNDFSPLVCREYPAIADALHWLAQFGPAHLTGSGAGLFLPCANERQAQDIVGQIPDGMIGFAAQGQNHSPLIY